MLSAVLVDQLQLDPHSGLSLDERLRQGTSGRPRPSTGLKAWASICRPLVEVDFIGCPASQGGVWPMLVVPDVEPRQFLSECRGAQRHQESSRTLDLHGLNEALHDGDAARLTHRRRGALHSDREDRVYAKTPGV